MTEAQLSRAIAVDDALQLVDERLAGEDDALLVVEKFLGAASLRIKIKIRFAQDLARIVHARAARAMEVLTRRKRDFTSLK